MKKTLVLLLILPILFAGCSNTAAPLLEDEDIDPVDAQQVESSEYQPEIIMPDSEEEGTGSSEEENELSLDEKMALIGFEYVSGYYTRKAIEEDLEYVEMFSFDKESFVRITTNELEREVFAYNYESGDFTYIYYIDGEMTARTKINIDTGAVLEDDEGYAELLSDIADEIKIYFDDLLEVAGLSSDELH